MKTLTLFIACLFFALSLPAKFLEQVYTTNNAATVDAHVLSLFTNGTSTTSTNFNSGFVYTNDSSQSLLILASIGMNSTDAGGATAIMQIWLYPTNGGAVFAGKTLMYPFAGLGALTNTIACIIPPHYGYVFTNVSGANGNTVIMPDSGQIVAIGAGPQGPQGLTGPGAGTNANNIWSGVNQFTNVNNAFNGSINGMTMLTNHFQIDAIGTTNGAWSVSNIFVWSPVKTRFTGNYTNVTPLGPSNSFIAWHQIGGTNYLTQNNPAVNSTTSSSFSYCLGGETNTYDLEFTVDLDSANNGVGIFNLYLYRLWANQVTTVEGSIPIAVYYARIPFAFASNNIPVVRHSVTNSHTFYVDAKNGSDLNDGRTPDTAMSTLTFIKYIAGATNYGDTIHVAPGIYNEGMGINSGVSIIGSGNNSNTTYVASIDITGNAYVANMYISGVSAQQWFTSNDIPILDNVTIEGSEPFFNNGGYTNEWVYFKNSKICGQSTFNNGMNGRFIDCTIEPAKYGPNIGIAGVQVNTGSTVSFEGCSLISGTNNLGANTGWLIGTATTGSGGSCIWNANNSIDLRLTPTCFVFTNCTVTTNFTIGDFRGVFSGRWIATNAPVNGAALRYTNGNYYWGP